MLPRRYSPSSFSSVPLAPDAKEAAARIYEAVIRNKHCELVNLLSRPDIYEIKALCWSRVRFAPLQNLSKSCENGDFSFSVHPIVRRPAGMWVVRVQRPPARRLRRAPGGGLF